MPDPCPFLPIPSRPLTAASITQAGHDRGPLFYHLALECAQALWLARLPAQSLLLLNRAFSADLSPEAPAARHWPQPYPAVAWILRHHHPDDFIGNPRRHYQHLATRMVEPRKTLRTWRAWACWAISRSLMPDLPADEKQLVHEHLLEPNITTIAEHLQHLGLPGESTHWLETLGPIPPP